MEHNYVIIQEVTQYRKEYQRPEDRREFDLNDPDYMKKDKPARVSTLQAAIVLVFLYHQTSDIDPGCTVSGAQIFQGEDLSLEERKQLQQEQMR